MLLSLLLLASACAPAPAPSTPASSHGRSPAARPSCIGEVDTAASSDSPGAKPFASAGELERSVGATVFVIKSQRLAGFGGSVNVLFGEPVLLCAAEGFRDPARVLDEHAFRARNVLVKTRSGKIQNIDVAYVSSEPPRVSLFVPRAPDDMLRSAFLEGLAAKQALETAPAGARAGAGRNEPSFWNEVARRSRIETLAVARQLVRSLVQGVNARPKDLLDAKTTRIPADADNVPWIARGTTDLVERYAKGIDDRERRKALRSLQACLARTARVDGKSCSTSAQLLDSVPTAREEATTLERSTSDRP